MMIGDSLRGEYLLSRDFSQRVTHPLTQEPTVLAARRGKTHHRLRPVRRRFIVGDRAGGLDRFLQYPAHPPARNHQRGEYSPARGSPFDPVSQRSKRRENESVADLASGILVQRRDPGSCPVHPQRIGRATGQGMPVNVGFGHGACASASASLACW